MHSVTSTRSLTAFLGIGALTLTLAACGNDDDGDSESDQQGQAPFAGEANDEAEDQPEDEEPAVDNATDPALEEPEGEDPAEDNQDAEEDPLEEDEDDEDDSTRLEDAEDDVVCQAIDTELLNDLAGGEHSFETSSGTGLGESRTCQWSSTDYSQDMLEADYYGGISLDATISQGDDLVSAEEYYEDQKDNVTMEMTELEGIGADAYLVEDLGVIRVLYDDDTYLLFQGLSDFWDDHAVDLAEEFSENWENR